MELVLVLLALLVLAVAILASMKGEKKDWMEENKPFPRVVTGEIREKPASRLNSIDISKATPKVSVRTEKENHYYLTSPLVTVTPASKRHIPVVEGMEVYATPMILKEIGEKREEMEERTPGLRKKRG